METPCANAPDGVSIAYQVVGDGPRDLVWVPGWVSHGEAAGNEPTLARRFDRLAGRFLHVKVNDMEPDIEP